MGDDPVFVAELIDDFVEQAPRQLETLREAATTGEAESAGRAAHAQRERRTFRPGARLLCLEAETAAAAGDLEVVRQRLSSVEAEWSRVREALRRSSGP